ncbi:Golgi CORVET complex core vacuolar protein 8-domain-containing protein [Neohortaea acidophila]|uniref:Golgi CORVET complex core vacuolar protein 8-domain-containing protein n=1 Tax=Neohortaea acidophila TaxID=245834 RepID=A0A6A6PSQ5_9PEZI|nr:Golgi CORVET complex core vacuolar protein 8-domain-containing protein [Neohortaea acidophila]KAF2482257.1 Golgi CORVET complex core vacuolar protein 8-domain-containing protein [Neohortaea acidophila]
MSSISGGSHSGGENEDIEADEATRDTHGRADGDEDGALPGVIEEEEQQIQQAGLADAPLPGEGIPDDGADAEDERLLEEDYAQITRERPETLADQPGEEPIQTKAPELSPAGSGSITDDSPSVHGTPQSSPGRTASPRLRNIVGGRKVSAALQPFERRFEARPSTPRSASLRADSPGFLSPHSRRISLSSQVSHISSQQSSAGSETPQAPWEVIKWTKLRKITGHAFSETGRRNFGRPTCLAVSALIAIGTTKGLILGFDYHQTLKIIIGQGTKATECGSITALAIAADYSTIAAGHADGHIFTWEINRPSQPFLRIPPLDRDVLKQSAHADGHIAKSAILHVGFLGTRHTALVSADAAGMAFAHLATRGLGPVTRSITTTRLLGRYPSADPSAELTRKPSSVLAFSPLPLGNVEQATDNMGLTALLTPYLLIIVSTTPTAQTQHKAPRPKEVSTHGTLSGCLAWFPAVKLKRANANADHTVSKTKLVYCWSNILTVLDLTVVGGEDPTDAKSTPSLQFHARKRWRAEEAIVAVQWLGRSVLGVLTVSQRLLILEDGSLQVTDSIDLLHRHIYHQDLFSQQLRSVVEHTNSAEPSLHGVVADAFYMSFRVYKGRTFLLGFDDLTVGTLSNWADRLMALMEAGDHIAAIRLATEYYAGSSSNVTIGLADADETRHSMVRERLVAMISASLSYTFSQEDGGRDTRLRELAVVSFDACIAMHELDYLFGAVFEIFEDADEEDVFISTLEPYVLDNEIKSIPPEVVKGVVAHFISENESAKLEELLCRLDPRSYDLDEVTMLCKQHRLYDALIYVWTQGIGDFVTPLIDLMSLVMMLQDVVDAEQLEENPYHESAMKVFPYLAYSLTGRKYPSGDVIDEDEATRAKIDLYKYLLSGRPVPWPTKDSPVFRTTFGSEEEPEFPYLVLLLQFDASSFMSMLNEAFEDAFLNDSDDEPTMNGSAARVNGTSPRSVFKLTRDRVITILLRIMEHDDFDREQIIYLYMFIARSLPKYPSQIFLPDSRFTVILNELCDPPADDLREDCQLSVEYLLSGYHPPDVAAVIESLKTARFYRVLKSVYRRSQMYDELLETYFEDPEDKQGVFDCIAICLRPSTGLSQKQVQSVKRIIRDHNDDLIAINTLSTARTIAISAPDLLKPSLVAIADLHTQFVFLRALLEPTLLRELEGTPASPLAAEQQAQFTEKYVQLMCTNDPLHVSDYIDALPTSDLRLSEVLPALESSGVVDAAVTLLARNGLARDGMERLVTKLEQLQHALGNLLGSTSEVPDWQAMEEATQHLVEDIEKYTKVGIWLCQGQTAAITERKPRPRTNFAWEIREDDLDLDEYLWLDLVDVVVQITKNTNQAITYLHEHPTESNGEVFDTSKVAAALRTNAQQTFTALLAATTAPKQNRQSEEETPPKHRPRRHQDPFTFLRVFRAFLSRAASTSPTLADLRTVLSDIFSAYTFEEGVLTLGNGLLGADVFAEIEEANTLRQRGWRPRSQVCEFCKLRAWGPGIGEAVWDEFVAREEEREAERKRKNVERSGGEEARRLERGKGKAVAVPAALHATEGGDAMGMQTQSDEVRRLALVVFSCRHVFHRVCLDADFRDGKPAKKERYQCPLCTAGEA